MTPCTLAPYSTGYRLHLFAYPLVQFHQGIFILCEESATLSHQLGATQTYSDGRSWTYSAVLTIIIVWNQTTIYSSAWSDTPHRKPTFFTQGGIIMMLIPRLRIARSIFRNQPFFGCVLLTPHGFLISTWEMRLSLIFAFYLMHLYPPPLFYIYIIYIGLLGESEGEEGIF